MTKTTFFVSKVEFRPEKAGTPIAPIALGIVLEFTTPDAWAVAFAPRVGLPEADLAELDKLTRALVEARTEIVKKEIEKALPEAARPGDVLRRLAAANPWSFRVSVPESIHALTTQRRGGSIQERAEKLLSLVLKPKEPSRTKPKAFAKVAGKTTTKAALKKIASSTRVHSRAGILAAAHGQAPWLAQTTIFRREPFHVTARH